MDDDEQQLLGLSPEVGWRNNGFDDEEEQDDVVGPSSANAIDGRGQSSTAGASEERKVIGLLTELQRRAEESNGLRHVSVGCVHACMCRLADDAF